MGEVLIGEDTLQLVRDAVEVELVTPLSLKGKREAVPAFRLTAVRAAGERPDVAPMIGRERELRRLEDAFAQMAHDCSCQLFTILGAPGVGKSRLSSEFLRSLGEVRAVRGRCLPYGEGITYSPVVEVLKQLDAFPSDAFAASALRSLLGESRTVASAEEIAWGFRRLLEEQARDGPLVVVFDDIQWGEETFLDLIEHVADLSRDAPVLLLCMARPELMEKRPGWGGGKWNATTVLLEPLDAIETDRLLDALGGVGDDLRERISEAAEGNPLFVEEMVELIRESGRSEVAVPPTIQALLAARLDQLVPEERWVLECGAVEGRTFHGSAVRALLEDATRLRERLVAVVRKELVRPARAQRAGDEAYRFRHLLIRDAAYDGLPKAVRAVLHERFAAWLEEWEPDLVEMDEILGYHLEQAARYRRELGQPDAALSERAGERLAAAGGRALGRTDNTAARGLLERALALLQPIRLNTYIELDLAAAQATYPEKVAMAEAAAERAREAHDHRGAAVADVMAASDLIEMTAISIDELEARVRHALALLEGTEDHFGLLVTWSGLATIACFRGHCEEWARAAEQARHHAEQIGRPFALAGLASALRAGPRPADEVQRFLERFLSTNPHPEWRREYAHVLAMLNRFDEAWATVEQASRKVDELGNTGFGNGGFAQIAMLAGDYEEAVGYWREFCVQIEETGNRNSLSTYLPLLGRSLCRVGRYDEAEPIARRAREVGDAEDVWTEVIWRQALALVCSHREQHEEAAQLAREALAIADRMDSLDLQGDALCDLAEVLEHAGRRGEAMDALQQALERYERKKNLAMVVQVRKRLEAGGRSIPLA